jgi:hypothetical protein
MLRLRWPVLSGQRLRLGGLGQFLNVRSIWLSIAVLVLIGVATRGMGNAALPALTHPISESTAMTSPVLIAAPMACASVIGLAVDGSMAAAESLAARDLTWHRVGHLVLLLTVSVLALLPAVSHSSWAGSLMVTVENLVGSAVVALAMATLGRTELSWMVLFPYGLLGLMVSPTLPGPVRWVFVINPTASAWQFWANIGLLLAATACFTRRTRVPATFGAGSRPRRREN